MLTLGQHTGSTELRIFLVIILQTALRVLFIIRCAS